MEKYNSIYLGICVQNNDPDHRGRVKVWVPHVNANIYNKWNQLKQDQTFAFPGSPNGENLSQIMPQLQDSLPWAEYAGPIGGSSTGGYYNAYSDTNSVSDAPVMFGQPGTNFPNASAGNPVDLENKGGKPGALYESNPVSDAFGNTAKINAQQFNQFSNNYKPSTYSNSAKGVFAIPNVGAHLWVFFREGSPLNPVYIGAAFGQEDFSSIFKNGDGAWPDYPGAYENKDKRYGGATNDNVTFRNKMVVNQRGAAIEIINTTDRESYKVTHFGGGFYELNNKYTSLFNPKNLQLLTLADKFETVNGYNSTFVGRDNDYIVQGDHWLKVGNFNNNAAEQWNALYAQLAGVSGTPADPSTISSSLNALIGPMSDAETQMGFGGNSFEFVTKHKVITVGLTQNTNPAYYYDILSEVAGTGQSIVTGVNSIGSGAFQPISSNFGVYKQLYVPDMPGGNLDIFAMSRFKVQSGTGGATIQTTGNMNLQGGTVTMTGDLVTVGSANGQVNVNGSLVTIGGDSLVLKSNIPTNQVVVDSSLGVSKNVIIGGGAYVEGELFVNHITAPIEYQVTENTQIMAIGPVVNPEGAPGEVASGWGVIGTSVEGSMVVALPPLKTASGDETLAVTIPLRVNSGLINLNTIGGGILQIAQPHSHVFKNIPLTLKNKPAFEGVGLPGPNEFNLYATSVIGVSNATAIGSEARFDGRESTVGVPPPSIYSVGDEGLPVNTPNGPGSDLAGPAIVPLT